MLKKIAIVWVVICGTLFHAIPNLEGEVMKNNTLDARQQAIVLIGAFAAQGNLEQLKTALNEGLDAGLTINEIKEILVQLYAYAGFPRSLNAISTFMAVMNERHDKGITDAAGKEASPLPKDKTSLELGTEIQTKLSGAPVTGAIFNFAPAIDAFLKAHLFGDIFGRDNLDYESREIATIAALASINGVNPQLQAHYRIGMNVGLSETQLKDLISVLEAGVGKQEANNAGNVLHTFLGDRAK